MLGIMAACWVLMDRSSGVVLLESVAIAAIVSLAVTPSNNTVALGLSGYAFLLIISFAIAPILHLSYRKMRRLPHGESALIVVSFALANAFALFFSYLVSDSTIAVAHGDGSPSAKFQVSSAILATGLGVAGLGTWMLSRTSLAATIEFARDDQAFLQSFSPKARFVPLIATAAALVLLVGATSGFVAVQERFGVLNFGRFFFPAFAIALAFPYLSPLRSVVLGLSYVAVVRGASALGTESLERAYQGVAIILVVIVQVLFSGVRRAPRNVGLAEAP